MLLLVQFYLTKWMPVVALIILLAAVILRWRQRKDTFIMFFMLAIVLYLGAIFMQWAAFSVPKGAEIEKIAKGLIELKTNRVLMRLSYWTYIICDFFAAVGGVLLIVHLLSGRHEKAKVHHDIESLPEKE